MVVGQFAANDIGKAQKSAPLSTMPKRGNRQAPFTVLETQDGAVQPLSF